jgi:hypothetical protein
MLTVVTTPQFNVQNTRISHNGTFALWRHLRLSLPPDTGDNHSALHLYQLDYFTFCM